MKIGVAKEIKKDEYRVALTTAGVQATRWGRFCDSRPTLSAANPSTSFATAMASNTFCVAPAPMAFGSGDCTRIPSCFELRFSRSTSARSIGCAKGRWSP